MNQEPVFESPQQIISDDSHVEGPTPDVRVELHQGARLAHVVAVGTIEEALDAATDWMVRGGSRASASVFVDGAQTHFVDNRGVHKCA